LKQEILRTKVAVLLLAIML
jgi:magnesium-transporting ATPase (P-type)